MLTRDRPEMANRAVECFRRQTYPAGYCWLFILNTGEEQLSITGEKDTNIFTREASAHGGDSIGALRNRAAVEVISGRCAAELGVPDILVHWDDDDYSSPHRIAEQVALLQASGADCVGYSDMLFWRRTAQMEKDENPDLCNARHRPTFQRGVLGEAWLYLGPQKALGTSLCYWRRTWERKPFPDQPKIVVNANGEDRDWIVGLHLCAITSMGSLDSLHFEAVEQPYLDGDRVRRYEPGKVIASGEPRMIASIHGGNTSGSYKLIGDSTSWRRVPEFDNYCRERMTL